MGLDLPAEAEKVLGDRAGRGESQMAVGQRALRDRGVEVGKVLDEPTVCKPHSCELAQIGGKVHERWEAKKLPAGGCVTKTTGMWRV